MARFEGLSHSQISELTKCLLVQRLPKSALLYNVALLYLNTRMVQLVPTNFYAYRGNINGHDAFVVARQAKMNTEKSVSWTISAPELEFLIPDMFKAFESLVDWTIANSFLSCHTDIKDEIGVLCRRHGVHSESGPCSVYCRGNLDGPISNLRFESENTTVVELDAEGIKKLVTHWEYASNSSFQDISDILALIPWAGVAVKVEDELVSWGYVGFDGAIHALFTLENHRGKGYAKTVLNSLSENLSKKVMHAIGQVDNRNLSSVKLMMSAGLTFSYQMHWVEFTPK